MSQYFIFISTNTSILSVCVRVLLCTCVHACLDPMFNLMCQVDEVMLTLKQAFTTAAALQSNKTPIQLCEACPMHDLHKLCERIEGAPCELRHASSISLWLDSWIYWCTGCFSELKRDKSALHVSSLVSRSLSTQSKASHPKISLPADWQWAGGDFRASSGEVWLHSKKACFFPWIISNMLTVFDEEFLERVNFWRCCTCIKAVFLFFFHLVFWVFVCSCLQRLKPVSDQEENELVLLHVRQLCEGKQKSHLHIGEAPQVFLTL